MLWLRSNYSSASFGEKKRVSGCWRYFLESSLRLLILPSASFSRHVAPSFNATAPAVCRLVSIASINGNAQLKRNSMHYGNALAHDANTSHYVGVASEFTLSRRWIISICTYVRLLFSNSASALLLFPWSWETLRLLLCRQMQQILQHSKQMNIWLWCNRVDHSGHWPPGGRVGVWRADGVSGDGEWNSKDKPRMWDSGCSLDLSFVF